jgi:hypothetical protein
MSNHDDRDGEEADVAYEAVAQLTVLAGSEELDRGTIDPQSGDQYVSTALSELHVLGQDLCGSLIWRVRALFAPPPPA